MSSATKKRSSGPAYALKDFDKAAEIALFYGFTPVKTPKIEHKDHTLGASLLEQKKNLVLPHELYPRPEEKAALLRTYTEWGMHGMPQPVMLYYRRPLGGSATRRSSSEFHAALEIIGSHSGVADAIAIKTTCAILSDYGLQHLNIDINSLGDRESMTRFDREVNTFVRKHSAHLPNELRQEFRQDPLGVIRSGRDEWRDIRNHAPQTLDCLSEPGSLHFKEVLEYLEASDTPYRINHELAPDRQYCSHTTFEIRHTEHLPHDELEAAIAEQVAALGGTPEPAGTVVAFGTRHNHIAKRIGFKKEIPFVSVNIGFKKKAAEPKTAFKNNFKPKFYFIQFGAFAKMKSLSLIETLRQARIPVYHSLTKDKFVGQLSNAETTATPFVIIMGQKEALENTVVVRHMSTRAQETIPVGKLASYLSKLR